MRINISIDEELLKATDGYASEFKYSRSELIAQALRLILFSLDAEKRLNTQPLHNVPTPENHESVIQATTSVSPTENFESLSKDEKAVMDPDTLDENGYLKPGNSYDFDYMKPIKKWCGLNITHPYGDPQDCYCISAEDENGNPVKHGKILLTNVWGCRKCVDSLNYSVMTGNTNG